MRTSLVVLSSVILAFCLGTVGSGEPSKPMPNRLLFTCLGWPTAQPDQDYYPAEISDSLVQDWKDYSIYLKELGFTTISPWGFLCNTLPYPLGVDTKSTETDIIRVSQDHVAKAQRIVGHCRDNGQEFYYGMCLYFAYHGDYLTASAANTDPKLSSVPCPLYTGEPDKGIPGSIEFMKQAIDFVAKTLPLDGIALESFHHGRCKCDACLKRFPDTFRGTAEFHRYANFPIFEHVRTKHPNLKILFCPEGPLEVIQRSENLDILKETLNRVDYFVWCGAIHPADTMKELVQAAPNTGLMLRQEPWQSVPPPGPRDGWFFPNLVYWFGQRVHERSKVIDWAGIAGCGLGSVNPSDNVNLRFLAQIQMNPQRDPEILAKEVLQEVYAPASKEALDKLYLVWSEPEKEFRRHWPTWFLHIDFMPTAYKFTPEQTVDMIGAYQLALARLRSIKSELENQEEAEQLESSIVNWIGYIKKKLSEDYQYEIP